MSSSTGFFPCADCVNTVACKIASCCVLATPVERGTFVAGAEATRLKLGRNRKQGKLREAVQKALGGYIVEVMLPDPHFPDDPDKGFGWQVVLVSHGIVTVCNEFEYWRDLGVAVTVKKASPGTLRQSWTVLKNFIPSGT